jgi:replication-associated recombination protein RarA
MIERVRLGQGKPDRIYVKCSEDLIRSMPADVETVESADDSPETDSPDLQNDTSQDVTDEHSAMPAPALPECSESAKLLYNQTNRTRRNQSDPIDPSARMTDRTDRRALYEQITGKKTLLYDKNGEEHYNLISALHKSMRNSDPDAAVYWLARMLEAGEDPLYIARRIVRFAAEDVGLADPSALPLAVSVYQACHFIGVPECNVHLTEAAVYLSLAPKSNSMETTYLSARDDALNDIAEPVPMNIRNAPTSLMDELGYGKGYKYAHDYEDKLTSMQCLPDSLLGTEYYHPGDQGEEARFAERLEYIKKWKEEH